MAFGCSRYASTRLEEASPVGRVVKSGPSFRRTVSSLPGVCRWTGRCARAEADRLSFRLRKIEKRVAKRRLLSFPRACLLLPAAAAAAVPLPPLPSYGRSCPPLSSRTAPLTRNFTRSRNRLSRSAS